LIKAIVLITLLNAEPAILPEKPKIEARKRHGKGQRGRKRGGGGLR